MKQLRKRSQAPLFISTNFLRKLVTPDAILWICCKPIYDMGFEKPSPSPMIKHVHDDIWRHILVLRSLT